MPEADVPHAPAEYHVALVALLLGLALLGIKLLAYLLTGSSAIFSDTVESVANVVAGGFALFSVSLAARPADADHPYGHGKVEFLSAGFEGGLVLAAAIVMTVQAIYALFFHPNTVDHLAIGTACMVLAILINGSLAIVLIRRGKKGGSLTLVADGKHLLTDAVTSMVALVALGIIYFFHWPAADPLLALLIAVYVAHVGVSLLKDSASGLMDKQDLADEVILKKVLDSHVGQNGKEPHICSYHKLKHRHSGRFHWVDFHIMLPTDFNVRTAHDIASSIEYEIEQALVPGNATAHVEPCKDPGCQCRCAR